MEWFIAALVVVALGAVAVAASGRLGGMSREPDRDVFRQNPWPDEVPVTPEEVSEVRFGITLRGYAMDQVDDVLDRLSAELATRDAIIAELRARLESSDAPR